MLSRQTAATAVAFVRMHLIQVNAIAVGCAKMFLTISWNPHMIAGILPSLREAADDKAGIRATPNAAATVTPSANDARWIDTLYDGTLVRIRRVRPQDTRLEGVFLDLSPGSRCYRFLGSIGKPDAPVVRQTGVDAPRDVAFIALARRNGIEHEIGIAGCSTNGAGDMYECTVKVADEWQKKGIGTLLMRHLIEMARRCGVHTMTSLDRRENRELHDLVSLLGFRCQVDPDDAAHVIHTLTL